MTSKASIISKVRFKGEVGENLVALTLSKIIYCENNRNPDVIIAYLPENIPQKISYDLVIFSNECVKDPKPGCIKVDKPFNKVIRRNSFVEVKSRDLKKWEGGPYGIPPERTSWEEKFKRANSLGHDYLLAYVFFMLDPAKYAAWFKITIFNSNIIHGHEDEWFIQTKWGERKSKEREKESGKKVIQLSICKILKLKPPDAIVLEASTSLEVKEKVEEIINNICASEKK